MCTVNSGCGSATFPVYASVALHALNESFPKRKGVIEPVISSMIIIVKDTGGESTVKISRKYLSLPLLLLRCQNNFLLLLLDLYVIFGCLPVYCKVYVA